MVVIGLTGDAGSGKSTVAKILEEQGAERIDADQIARELTAPGTPLLAQIIEVFGPQYLKSNGVLNRRKLGDLVFADRQALECLNQLTHPHILQALKKRIDYWRERHSYHRNVLVVEVPLLFETGSQELFDEVWVVAADWETKIGRLLARGMNIDKARNLLQSQMPQDEKVALAHRVVNNNGSLEQTRQQALRYWEDLIESA
ncbi:MAG: dephospho-CoA kinase [Peptococcaceae bacterium]|nr:dephospho-CoA kinase [Peptococcaceae bacterium]